jgi:hypothetical protein
LLSSFLIAPAYLQLLPEGSQPTADLEELLTRLAQRMGMIGRGSVLDLDRAAQYFVRWWREEGGLVSASSGIQLEEANGLQGDCQQASIPQAWGFDFQWEIQRGDSLTGEHRGLFIQKKMEGCIDKYLLQTEKEEREERNVSSTQRKKQAVMAEKDKRRLKYLKRK